MKISSKRGSFNKNKAFFLSMIMILTISFSYFVFAVFDGDGTGLVSPEDCSWDNDGNVTFVCTFNLTEPNDMINYVLLYTNISGGWTNTSMNNTNMTPAGIYTYHFNMTDIGDGSYEWNCEAYDNGTGQFFASGEGTMYLI